MLCSVFLAAGSHGPRGWAASYPECAAKNQSPVDITDEQAVVSDEYQELMLEKFNAESSNQTTMKNTGKTGARESRYVHIIQCSNTSLQTVVQNCTLKFCMHRGFSHGIY